MAGTPPARWRRALIRSTAIRPWAGAMGGRQQRQRLPGRFHRADHPHRSPIRRPRFPADLSLASRRGKRRQRRRSHLPAGAGQPLQSLHHLRFRDRPLGGAAGGRERRRLIGPQRGVQRPLVGAGQRPRAPTRPARRPAGRQLPGPGHPAGRHRPADALRPRAGGRTAAAQLGGFQRQRGRGSGGPAERLPRPGGRQAASLQRRRLGRRAGARPLHRHQRLDRRPLGRPVTAELHAGRRPGRPRVQSLQ